MHGYGSAKAAGRFLSNPYYLEKHKTLQAHRKIPYELMPLWPLNLRSHVFLAEAGPGSKPAAKAGSSRSGDEMAGHVEDFMCLLDFRLQDAYFPVYQRLPP